MGREANREQVRQLSIREPQVQALSNERLLKIEMPKQSWDWPMALVAQYALRLALENQCTRVRVVRGISSYEYDVLQLLDLSRKLHYGGALTVPRYPHRPPAYLATMGHKALGSVVDKTRPMIAVPHAVSGRPQKRKDLAHV